MANNQKPVLLKQTCLSIDKDSDKVFYGSSCTIDTFLDSETSVTVVSNEVVEHTGNNISPARERTHPHITLQQAARDNSIETVDEWIEFLSTKGDVEKKEKLNEKDEYGMAAIHYAAKHNHYLTLVKLCENGADATLATTEELFTPLHYAAYYIPPYQVGTIDEDIQLDHQEIRDHFIPSKKTVEYLAGFSEVDVNIGDKYKVSPLHLACRRGNFDAAEILLCHHAIIPDIKDEHDDTPLHEACLHGSDVVVDLLLTNATVSLNFYNSFNKESQTPLHLACIEGHTNIVKRLLAKCPREKIKDLLEAHDRRGNTAFHLTVESLGLANEKDTETIRVLLEYGANPSAGHITEQDSSQQGTVEIGDRVTPLHIAARHGLVEVIEILLTDDRVLPNVVEVNHQTPLHFAAMHNQPGAVTALIQRGANPELKDINSCTPFLLAAAYGHREVVRVLNERTPITNLDRNRRSAVFLAAEGAHQILLGDLIKICDQTSLKLCSTPDIHLNTPLHIAAKLGHLNIVEELLKDNLVKPGHVKLDAKNESKKTPAHLAAENGHVKVLKRLTAKSKALVLHEDEDGNTPLHLAAAHGWKHSAILLMERRANVDARNVCLATPLSLAAGSGHVKIVKLLLQFKADIDVKDRNQATPLHYAVRKGHVDVVKVLITSGAKCSLKDKDGNNALDLAIDHGHEDVAKVIISSDQWEEALRNTTVSLGSSRRKYKATTPFRKMITKMPDVARDVLNRCTTYSDGDKGRKVTKYNYRYIEDVCEPRQDKPTLGDKVPFKWAKNVYLAWINRHFRSEKEYSNTWGPKIFDKHNHPLTIMAESDDGRLISHPLVVSLLMFKLRKYATFYYLVHLVFHLLFVFFLTTFALMVDNPKSEMCEVVFRGQFGSYEIPNNVCGVIDDGNETMQALCGYCGTNIHHRIAISVAARVSAALAILRLIIFLAISLVKPITAFVTSLRSWIEIPMFVCSIFFVSVFGTECHCPTVWQWQFGTIAILLVWIDLINTIRKLQVFDIGIYVLMFESIIMTFMHTVFLSVLLLIAFSLAFYMAFFQPGMNFTPLSNPGQSILSVMSYIVGAVDYNGLFSLSHENLSKDEHLEVAYLPISILLWIVFLVIMVILLVNMLIGLAVDDIRGIKRAAEVQRLKLLVDLTLNVDSVLIYRHLFRVPEKTVKMNGISIWKACNTFLWKGNIVQDTPEIIAKAMKKNSELSMEQVYCNTHALVREMATTKETLKAMNDRNRRMETALVQLSTIFATNFNYSPTPDYEFRTLQDNI